MRRLALVALILLAGCSGDPASSRLKMGDECIVRKPEAAPNRSAAPKVQLGDGTEAESLEVSPRFVAMKSQDASTHFGEVGSKIRVISDEQPPDIRPADKPYLADLDGAVDRRWVKVNKP